MIRELPIIYGQRDFLQQLGHTPGSTIAEDGCYLTSFADAARYYGKDTDPVRLNQSFIDNNLYINADGSPGGNLMRDDNLHRLYPDIVYQKSYYFPDATPTSAAVPADLELLKQLLADPTLFVIVKINTHKGYYHFAPVIGINGVVTIANPYTKSIEDFATNYGDPKENIIKYVVYKGNPATVEKAVNSSELQQAKTDRDLNWNMGQAFAATIGLSLTDDRERNIQLFKDKIDLLNHTITENATMAAEYKKKYDEEALKVIDLNKANATISSENQDSATKAYSLEKELDDHKDVVKEIAKEVGVLPDEKNLLQKTMEKFYELKDKATRLPAAPPPPTPDTITTGLSSPFPPSDPPTDPRTKSLGQNFVVQKRSILSVLFGWAFEGGAV